MTRTGLRGIAYTLGETDLDVDSLPNRSAVLAAHDMPDMKELWGWDRCRRTERDALALAIECAERTLDGSDAANIDGLILCCGDPVNYFEQNQFIAEMALALGLRRFQSQWLGGSGCVTLFAAMRLARSLIQTGANKQVLVVTVDRITDDAQRFQRFGVLSDGACSFVACAAAHSDFELLDVVVQSSTATLRHPEDFQAKCQLIHSALEHFGDTQDFDFSRVVAFFGPNVFQPIQELELSLLPIDGAVAYEGNGLRYGHCYAADPMINLIDSRATAPPRTGPVLLASTAHGHFGIVALQERARR